MKQYRPQLELQPPHQSATTQQPSEQHTWQDPDKQQALKMPSTLSGTLQYIGDRVSIAFSKPGAATETQQSEARRAHRQRAEALQARDRELAALGPPPPKPCAPQGVYIYGSVGSGKSRLMDMFYGVVTAHGLVPRRRRVHVNTAMLEVNARLHHLEEEARLRRARDGDEGVAAMLAGAWMPLPPSDSASAVDSMYEPQPGHGRQSSWANDAADHGSVATSLETQQRPIFVPDQDRAHGKEDAAFAATHSGTQQHGLGAASADAIRIAEAQARSASCACAASVLAGSRLLASRRVHCRSNVAPSCPPATS
jgi:AFG1-like ATPase